MLTQERRRRVWYIVPGTGVFVQYSVLGSVYWSATGRVCENWVSGKGSRGGGCELQIAKQHTFCRIWNLVLCCTPTTYRHFYSTYRHLLLPQAVLAAGSSKACKIANCCWKNHPSPSMCSHPIYNDCRGQYCTVPGTYSSTTTST
jgi:hypothetical protein